ncbi:hypothetical protein [Massilia sp. TN1-12]|uniref:hypothetical protein n=1 Tax=Massilia paldalensis TaxID=3377675 RepID=UPI00384FEC8A
MQKRENDRRQIQAVFYDAINDRRRDIDRRDQPAVPAVAGSIRPAPGVILPRVERRRFPESGTE